MVGKNEIEREAARETNFLPEGVDQRPLSIMDIQGNLRSQGSVSRLRG
jgi:hypothetical protein